jgi:CHAT domain-containing protein/Tfp pilus assembly protein PilF
VQRAGYQKIHEGDLAAAEIQANQGQRRAGDALWEWRFRVLRADVLRARGRYADALALVEPSRREGPLDPADVRARMIAGAAHCRAPDAADSFQRADAELAEAQSLAERLGVPELRGEVLVHRGTCLLFAGDSVGAESPFRAALEAGRASGAAFLEASAAGSLGLLRVRTGRYDDGADWLKRSLELSTRIGAHAITVATLQNLGWCYDNLGDYDRALDFLQRGEPLAQARGFGYPQQTILTAMGSVYHHLGDLGRAADAYQRALGLARDLKNRAEIALELHNLAIIDVESGRYDDAERQNAEALALYREVGDLGDVPYSYFTSGQIAVGRGALDAAEARFREALEEPHADDALRWEAHAALAGVLVKRGRPADADAEFRAAFALMDRSRALLHASEPRISFFASLRRFRDDYLAFLVDQKREREALEVADRGRARQLRELGPAAPAGVETFQETAAALDATLLFYAVAPGRSYLWVVTARGLALHALPGEDEIRKRVDSHQARILRSRDPLDEGAADAVWLYDELVRPAAIPAGARVIVAPDGPLHGINFETLVVSAPRPHYWIEDVTVATAPSLALLAGPREPPPAERLLVVGDPAAADPDFPPLAAAADEVRRIAEQFPERSVYVGPLAEPSIYKRSDPGRYSIIHFAAHAQASAEAPLDSAVILSPKHDAHKLYARDIAEVPIRAELVTLSACRGAGSRAYAGEGLVGLAWAFLGSGARNVIAGLWNVADTATPELMAELYRGIRRGLAPADALRQAQLLFLHSDGARRKPFYWAAYVVYTRER